jgi:hypothetical protein
MRQALYLAMLLTAGCGGRFDDTATQLQPGQWEEATDVLRVVVGDPSRLPVKVVRCIPAEAGQKAEAFMPEWGQSNCDVAEFVIGKGRVRGAAKCNRTDGTIATSFEGRFSATAYETTSRIDSNLAGKKRIVEERTRARRLGDCPGGQEQVVKITV